jgi:uncharacterized protein YcfJ
MKSIAKTLFAVSVLAFAAHASAQVTFHENENFQGRSFSSQQRVGNFERAGFNDRASSVIVVGQRWEACEHVRLEGNCKVLRPGQYPSLSAMGLNDRISSVRPVPNNERIAESAYAPMPIVAQDYRRRRQERLYDAEVTSVRGVAGTPAQRCWIEREQVAQQPQPVVQQQPAGLNLPGAAIGAVIGGILGHQVGGGSGQKIATGVGALGGAALGSQYGRHDQPVQQAQAAPLTQDVRRCDNNAAQAVPAYWDVTYKHEGIEHRVQMATPPGQTITVNRRGEPRA